MFRPPLLRNVARMANDEFQLLTTLQPTAQALALLPFPIKLLCAETDPWVPQEYIQQYRIHSHSLLFCSM
jgi:hypothetical protein